MPIYKLMEMKVMVKKGVIMEDWSMQGAIPKADFSDMT